MRFYRIEIRDQQGQIVIPSSLGNLDLTSLLPTGQTNTAALNIELDIPVAPYHVPGGQGFLRIWGLGLADLGSSFNLNGFEISIFAGMAAGLPLANPAQARLLVKGQIFQAFGNWLGTEQTVDLIFTPPAGTSTTPVAFTLNWQANTSLASALQTTIQNALPSAALEIQLSPRLTQNHDEVGVYASLTELASFLNPLSKKIITDAAYVGVNISYDGATVKVTDLSTQPPVKKIAFTDLIGQPTWIAPNVIQAKLVMRGDLDLLDTVNLPPSLVGNTAAAMASVSGNPANNTNFSGDFNIVEIHHYGNFRQPDAGSWNTTVNMIKKPPAVSNGSGVSGGL